jgi:hypothetical protein
LLILAFVTPALINKKPGPIAAPQYHPLGVWLAVNGYFTTAAVANQLWSAAILGGVAMLSTAALALYGASTDQGSNPAGSNQAR